MITTLGMILGLIAGAVIAALIAHVFNLSSGISFLVGMICGGVGTIAGQVVADAIEHH